MAYDKKSKKIDVLIGGMSASSADEWETMEPVPGVVVLVIFALTAPRALELVLRVTGHGLTRLRPNTPRQALNAQGPWHLLYTSIGGQRG